MAKLGKIQRPITSSQVIAKNKLAVQPRTGYVIPFYNYFAPSTRAKTQIPASWLTNR